MEPDPVLDLAVTKVAQARRPLPVLDEVIGYVLGKENVSSVPAIHDPLRHVDPRSGDVRPSTDILYLAHRPAVNAHPYRKLGMLAERFGNLQRATRRFLRTMPEHQRHAIAGREPD